MAGVRDHTELNAWKLADELRRKVHDLVATSGFSRRWKLREQLLTSSHSACANIAEGFSRFQPRDFARFLRMARGSMSETIEHLTAAAQQGLIAESEAEEMFRLARRARGAMTRLAIYLDGAKAPPTRG